MATKGEVPVSEATNITVRDFLTQYQDVAKNAMKRRSYETFRDIARVHLLPTFEGLRLQDLVLTF